MSFKEPTYTQTPNDFFGMIPEMSDAELRVTLVMVRETFGFHRRGFRMGIPDLAEASGLSINGAKTGAEAAEARGTFRRVNPDSKTKAEWELIIEPSASDRQPVTVEPSASDGQDHQPVTHSHGAKESINKVIKKKGDYLDLLQDMKESGMATKAQEIAEMYNRLDAEFKSSFARNAKNDVIVKFIIQREALGESLQRFGQWARRDEFNASRIWEYAENPIKIKTRWQVAMDYTNTDNEYHGASEGV